MATSCRTTVQYRRQDADTVKIQNLSSHKYPSCCLFRGTFTPHAPTPLSIPLATTNLSSISMNLSSQDGYVSGIIQYVTFWELLLLLSIIFWGFIQAVPSSLAWYGCTTVCLAIQLLKDTCSQCIMNKAAVTFLWRFCSEQRLHFSKINFQKYNGWSCNSCLFHFLRSCHIIF